MEIKKLLEKYYEGKTSLKEEKFLARFFDQEDIPAEFIADREVFLTFSESINTEILDEEFDSEIMDLIQKKTVKVPGKQRILYYVSAIAAGFTLLFGTYFLLIEDRIPFGNKTTFEMVAIQDPDMALEETRKALYLISEVFNKGTEELTSISKFSEGTAHLEGLGKIYEVEQLLTTKQ
jgi:hypothetical protein